MKVLIADDDLVTRKLTETLVTHWGYDVVVAGDGGQAWELAQQLDGSLGLALLDLEMPIMDGLELCRRIRAMNASGYVYVILLTAHGGKENIVTGLDMGADDYITKPFHAEELRVRIQAGVRVVSLERALLLANEQLCQRAMTDSLTGLLNHGAVFQRLDEELSRATRQAVPLAVAMIDLDHFKRVNDEFGHPAGDGVLAETTRRLRSALRDYDVLGRCGGEEFLVILPQTDAAGAAAVAARCCAAAAETPIEMSAARRLELTVSIGVAATDLWPAPPSANLLLKHADLALYEAKNAGRNRVAVAQGAALTPPR